MAKLSYPGFENAALMPLPPMPATRETFDFLTDVVETHNGTEDRTQVRAIARGKWQYPISADLRNAQAIFNAAQQNLRGDWAVPIWAQAQFVGNLNSATVPCEPELSDFRQGGVVMFASPGGKFETAQISAITGSTLILAEAVSVRNAYIMPVHAARVTGDIGRSMRGFNTAYDFDFEMTDPRQWNTKLGIHISLDVSGSMGFLLAGTDIARIDIARQSIVSVLTAIRGAIVNSNVSVDLRLSFWANVVTNYTYVGATVNDIDAAIIAAQTFPVGGGTAPLNSFNSSLDFFGTVAPNDGDRKDILLFTMDPSDANLTSSAAAAAAMINRNSPYDGSRSVDIYAINFESSNFTEALKVDNASGGQITNVTAADPGAMERRFLSAVNPVIGYQHDGYEVLYTPPVGSEFQGQTNKIEDRIDFEIGKFEVRSPWLNGRTSHVHSFFIDGLSEMLAFRRWLYRRLGKRGAFIFPVFQHNARPYDMNSERTQLFIRNDDFNAWGDGWNRLFIQFTSGAWQIVNVVSVVSTVTEDRRLTLSAPVNGRLQDIAQICYAVIGRLDADKIEINHIGDLCAETSISMTGLNG